MKKTLLLRLLSQSVHCPVKLGGENLGSNDRRVTTCWLFPLSTQFLGDTMKGSRKKGMGTFRVLNAVNHLYTIRFLFV